jgi:hypothetical protein
MVAGSATPIAAMPLPPKPITPLITAPAVPAVPVRADAADDVKSLKTDLENTNRQLKRLTELLEGIKDQPSVPGALKKVSDLRDDYYKLEQRVAAIEKQLNDMKNSTSLKPPVGPAPGAVTPGLTGRGTVRIINDYPIEVTILVNEKTYRVAPNTALDVPVSVGDFTYQLISSGTFLAPVKGPIGEKEVVRLRIK